jgi:predicted ATP-grasp superfamily ATP-dependent carboligase
MRELAAIGSGQTQKPVLIPCLDGKVLTVSRARDELARWYHIVLPPPEAVEMLMDKSSFYRYAMEHGFPIPFTCILGPGDDLSVVPASITYPLAVKPAFRGTAWTAHTTDKAFKVTDRDELESVFARCRDWAEELIVQQWIPGGVSELFSCNCYFGVDGELLVTFVAKKLRQWPTETGQSSLGVECRDDVVLEESIRLLSSVGYRGLGYVEMKRHSETGEYFIVEPNIGRPTGRSAIAEAGGVDLLYTMYCDAAGLPLPSNRRQHYGDVKWIHLRRDLQSAFVSMRRGDLSVRDWLRSIRGRKAYAVFSFSDPMPFVFDIVDALKKAIGTRRDRA